MCRIAGQVSLNIQADEKRSQVSAMALSMQHGGPDGDGLFLDDKNSTCFGHRRLALLDLSADGAQPMTDVTGNYTITFNGEIYNYQSLKTELQNFGYQFKNQSDTEVILVAYAHWGLAAFDHLNGMFAFALFDKRQQKVLLVRDQSGMKPLYYQAKNQQLVFASEIRAFRTIGIHQENPDWRILFLAFGFIPEPQTTLKDVQMLPKGCFLEWDIKAEKHYICSYLKAKATTQITTLEEAKYIIKQQLHQAVQRHLIADAPVGLFLSGGIDSSIIALEAAQNKGSGLHTLSVTFEDARYDESKYQLMMADKITSQHHQLHLSNTEFNTDFDTILNAMDQPSADGINTWFVSKLAEKHGLKAVLSGLGGDELFGGYPSFKRMKTLRKLEKNMPDFGLNLFRKFPIEAYQKLVYLTLHSNIGYYLCLRGYFIPQQIASILNRPVKEVWETISQVQYPTNLKKDTDLCTADLEQNLYMQNQLLRDSDTMSMQHGIEIRMPFLDTQFLAAVNAINSNIRFDKKLPKGLLIKSYEHLLPTAIWDRPKKGFSFPLQTWLKSNPITAQLKASKNPSIASFTQGFLQDRVHWSKIMALHLATNF